MSGAKHWMDTSKAIHCDCFLESMLDFFCARHLLAVLPSDFAPQWHTAFEDDAPTPWKSDIALS